MKIISTVFPGKLMLPTILLAIPFLSATAAGQSTSINADRTATGTGAVSTAEARDEADVNGKLKIRSGAFFLRKPVLLIAVRNKRLTGSPAVFDPVVLGTTSAGDYLVLNAGGTERARVNTNGFVGIGTANPVALLAGHIALGTDVVNSLATFGYNDSLTNRSIVFEQIGNAGGANQFIFLNGHLGSGSVADTPKFSSNYAPTFGIESNDNNLNLVTSAAGTNVSAIRALSVIPSGNVGIGDTSPASRLTVAGSGGDAAIQLRFSPSYGQTRLYTGFDSANLAGNYLAFRINQTGGSDSESMRIVGNGNVGIGTTTPAYKLDLLGDLKLGISTNGIQQGFLGTTVRANYDHIMLGRNLKGDTVSGTDAYKTMGTTDSWGFGGIEIRLGGDTAFYAQNGATTSEATVTPTTRMLIQGSTGNVGIGVNNPAVALDVHGDIQASGAIKAKYQDVAEWVLSSQQLAAGTVVVLDSTKSNQVTSSITSYDTRVAGVVSEQPGIALGEKSEGKVLVATTGRVRVKVDATKGPIHIGDLLVTSDVPGVAMKSEPVEFAGRKMHMPGTLIGKALEPLEKGKGEILVLLSLQ